MSRLFKFRFGGGGGGGGAARLKIIYKGVHFTRPRPDRAVEFTGCVSEFSVLV